jgi:hypothetical protein
MDKKIILDDKKTYFLLLLLNLFLIYLFHHFIGLYPEDHTESELSVHHNGIFLSEPVTLFNNWNVFSLITYPIVYLQKILPLLNIHGIFLIFCIGISMSNYLMLFATASNKYKVNNQIFKLLLFLLLILVFLFYDIFSFQYIKVSIHLLASGLLLYNIQKNKGLKAIGIFSILVGICLRYEASFIVYLYLFLTYCILNFQYITKYNLYKLVKKNILFPIITILIIIFCSYNYTAADKLYYPFIMQEYKYGLYQ